MRIAYLDIETAYGGKLSFPQLCEDFENHEITIIGIRLMDGTDDSFLQLVGKDISRERLVGALENVGLIVTYNGRSEPDELRGRIGFDFPVIAARLGIALDKIYEHLDLVPECWRRGLYGGQKKVEAALALTRQLPGRDGGWADEIWKKYRASGNQQFLSELMAYNKEDVFMLRRIHEALANVPLVGGGYARLPI